MLPITWERGCTKEVIEALEFVRAAMAKGQKLSDAVKLFAGRDTSTSNGAGVVGIDWDTAFEKFKRHKLRGDVSDERSFMRNDGSRWRCIGRTLAEIAPENSAQFFEIAVMAAKKENGKWVEMSPGSEGRRKKVQMINQFLTFCVEELGFDSRWEPPRNYAKFIGKKPKASKAGVRQRNKKDAVPEAALKPLMESFRDTPVGKSWRLAVGLMACFGLRPWELWFIEVDGDVLRVTEGKKNQRQADPRMVIGIDPEGMPGLSQQLLLELASGTTPLPKLSNHPDQSGNRVNEYLSHNHYWVELKAAAAAKGEKLASYSFRHRYAYAADLAGFNDREASQLMGNSRQTFVSYYGNKAREDELRAAAERLLWRTPNALGTPIAG